VSRKTGGIGIEFRELQDQEHLLLKREVDKYFEENKPYSNLGRTSLLSGATYVAARGVTMIVQVASTIVLARLLSPHDFGLVAMVLALVGFAPLLIDLGTSDASAQKTHITEVEVSTLFWLNVAIGGIFAVFLAGASGLIAVFFGEPALTGIARGTSLTFIMTAVSTQHYALMRRAMQFRRLAIIDITSNVIGSVVAIAMAFTGWGYWALVAKPIVTVGLTAAGAWMSCPWVPGRPRLTPEVKELVGFGIGVTGFSMTDYFAQSDRLALGYFYGAGQLGYFQNAFLLYSNLLVVLTVSLHQIATSGLSKLRNNVDELKRSWAAALSLMTFISVAVFAVLAVTGQDFVVIVLGQKWAPTGPLLSIFAVRGIAQSAERTAGWLHVAAGRSDRWMRWGFFSAICQLVALIAGLPFGLIGVAIAYTIVMFGLFVPALVYAGHPVGIGVRDVLSAVGPQTAAGLIAAAFGLMVQQAFPVDFSALMRFFLSSAICTATYLTVVVGVFRVTGPLHLAVSMLRDFGPMRSRGSS
jgi:polysaccharide transporter, PST family